MSSLYLIFRLGNFIAKTILSGIIHPDMQLCNIGFSDRNFKFVDFGNVDIISIPEDLTAETLQRLTESLFPLLDDIPNNFTFKSYFRAGFTSYGGILTHDIFSNAVNNGFSSFLYTLEKPIKAIYNAVSIYSDKNISAAITEWKTSPLDRVTLENYPCLDAYSKSAELQCISPYNRYYLNNLYFIHSYLGLKDTEAISQLPILILNIAMSAQHFGLTYTAYGLYQKCLSMKSDIADVNAICHKGLRDLSDIYVSNPCIVDFIKECTCYDLFELLWILNDLDNFIFT